MRAGLWLAVAAGLSAAGGCGGGPNAGSQSGADSVAARSDSLASGPGERPSSDAASAADSSAAAGTAGADSTAGDRRPLRKRLLRLVNGRAEEVVVHAEAGLERVVLDSVPAGDSTEVYVESRARRVGLRAVAVGADGPAASDSVDLTATGAARWLIPPEPDSSSAADP